MDNNVTSEKRRWYDINLTRKVWTVMIHATDICDNLSSLVPVLEVRFRIFGE